MGHFFPTRQTVYPTPQGVPGARGYWGTCGPWILMGGPHHTQLCPSGDWNNESFSRVLEEPAKAENNPKASLSKPQPL